MQIQPVLHLSILIPLFGLTVGAIFGAPLIGLAGGIAIVIAATFLE